jgi:hypothetical protein
VCWAHGCLWFEGVLELRQLSSRRPTAALCGYEGSCLGAGTACARVRLARCGFCGKVCLGALRGGRVFCGVDANLSGATALLAGLSRLRVTCV